MGKKSFFVLMLHGIVPEKPAHFLYRPNTNCFVRESDFEKIISFCSSNYKILKLADLELYFNDSAEEDGVLITFDDGLQSLFEYGVPILKKYKVNATVFITSDWTEKACQPAIFSLEYQLYHHCPANIIVSTNDFHFEARVDNKNEVAAVVGNIWDTLFDKKLAPLSLLDSEISINGNTLDMMPLQPAAEWKTMSWDFLKREVESGILEIGAHGQTHTPFTWLTNEQLEKEFKANKKQIFDRIGIEVQACSYPHGLIDQSSLNLLDKYFTYGFSNNIVSAPFGIERIEISRYNVPFQRPNNLDSLVKYPKAAKWVRRIGSVTGLF